MWTPAPPVVSQVARAPVVCAATADFDSAAAAFFGGRGVGGYNDGTTIYLPQSFCDSLVSGRPGLAALQVLVHEAGEVGGIPDTSYIDGDRGPNCFAAKGIEYVARQLGASMAWLQRVHVRAIGLWIEWCS